MKHVKTIIATATLLLSLPSFGAFNQPPPGYSSSSKNTNKNQENVSLLYPADNSPELQNMPDKLRQNHFEINIDKDEVESVQKSANRFKKLINGTYNVNIMQKIDYRPFKAIDNIFLLTNYTTTITFPPKYKIIKAISSSELKENRVSENVLLISPKNNFLEGNMVVSLSDGRRNTIVNLMLESFVMNDNRINNVVNLFIKYVEVPAISNYKLLKMYFKLYGAKRISFFKENGSFDVIEYKKVPFRIIRDDNFGNIEFMGINFRITNGN